MKRILFSICAALAAWNCSGENINELPILGTEDYDYGNNPNQSSPSGRSSSSGNNPYNPACKVNSESTSFFAAQRPFWELEVDGANVRRGGLDGTWFSYDDSQEYGYGRGGCTTVNFPQHHPICADDWISVPWKTIKTLTFKYEGDCTYPYPYAGIGFNLVYATYDDGATCHIDGDGITTYPPALAAPDKIPYRDGGIGIRIWYELEGDGEFRLEMSTADVPGGDRGAGITGFNEFYRILTKGNFLENGRDFYFEDFRQEGAWGNQVSVEEALNAITGFRFKGDFRQNYLSYGEATLTITKMEWIGANGNSTSQSYCDNYPNDPSCSTCNVGYCLWEGTNCVKIAPDPNGDYGDPTPDCAAALANCETYGQRFNDATCGCR